MPRSSVLDFFVRCVLLSVVLMTTGCVSDREMQTSPLPTEAIEEVDSLPVSETSGGKASPTNQAEVPSPLPTEAIEEVDSLPASETSGGKASPTNQAEVPGDELLSALGVADFSGVQVLPDNVLLPSGPLPAGIMESLMVFGGGGDPCGGQVFVQLPDENTSRGWIDFIRLCGYEDGSAFTLELIKPNNTSISQNFNVLSEDEMTNIGGPQMGNLGDMLCIDSGHLVESGSYQVNMYAPDGVHSSRFQVDRDTENPTVFVSQPTSVHRFASVEGCWSTVTEQTEFMIFFDGFFPQETLQILLYGSAFEDSSQDQQYLTSWEGITDEHGRLIQYASSPQLPFFGEYRIVVLAKQRERTIDALTGESTAVSAIALFAGIAR